MLMKRLYSVPLMNSDEDPRDDGKRPSRMWGDRLTIFRREKSEGTQYSINQISSYKSKKSIKIDK